MSRGALTLWDMQPPKFRRQIEAIMAVSDEVRKRFGEYVKVQAFGGRFIDRETERKILENGVMRFELSLEEGRQILLGVAAENGFVFETDAGQRLRDILESFAEDDKINRREFTDAVNIYRKLCVNAVSEDDARKAVKRIMIAEGFKPKRQGLLGTKGWYRRVDAD